MNKYLITHEARIGSAGFQPAGGKSGIYVFLITYESHLPPAGPRWQGFRRLRDDLSGWIDRRFPLSNYPPTAIDHRVRARGEDCA